MKLLKIKLSQKSYLWLLDVCNMIVFLFVEGKGNAHTYDIATVKTKKDTLSATKCCH